MHRSPVALPSLRPSTRRSFLSASIGAALGVAWRSASAAGPELRIVVRDNSEATKQILLAIDQRVGSFVSAIDARALATRPGRGVYVTLGPAALDEALGADLAAPIVSLFTSASAFRRLAAGRRAQATGIFAEASIESQMQVARALYKRRVTVGVLLSEATAGDEELLRAAATAEELDLEVVRVEPGGQVLRALAQLRAAKVLLALPDPTLYTADTLRGVLESTYRREQGVIGFSATLVGAGVLAAPYSTVHDTVAEFAELLPSIGAGALFAPHHPTYWRVAINESVARSLNLVIDPAAFSLGRLPR